MPLKERKPFKRIPPPDDLRPDEDLFYLKATHEVFRNYDEFFERVIMCNSLVWQCSLTGKAGLTFAEAVACEGAARHSLRHFPPALRRPLLHLAARTRRSRLQDMCDDVFAFARERFFVGEEVEVLAPSGLRKSSEVTQVILPEQKAGKSPAKADTSKQKKKDIPPSKIKYEVVNYSTGKTTIVKPEAMNRPKGTFTKPLNKLFLKHHTQPQDGIWQIKESVSQKEQLEDFNFAEVHCGPLPPWAQQQNNVLKGNSQQQKASVQAKLNFKKEEDRRQMQKVEEEREKMRQKEEQRRIKMEELKERQKNERLKRKEEKRRQEEYLRNWNKPRDDLECDDLKDLPLGVSVECGVPHTCFGDALMLVEFLHTFHKQVQVKDVFPQGVTFEHVSRALTEGDVGGPLGDLLQLLLSALFRYQEAEDDPPDLRGLSQDALELGHLDIEQATDFAAIVSTWPQKYHGTLLRNLPLDAFSVSEVLRLHVLASGWRRRVSWQGVTSPSEDPGLLFKVTEADLLRKLHTHTVFECTPEERCKLLCLLVHQLLCSDVLRYAVDENADATRPLRHQLKQLRWAHLRTQRTAQDTAAAGQKKLKENTQETNGETRTQEEEEGVGKEEQQREFERKEREIEQQIRKLQSSFNVVPLGRDRAFRRYWVFQTVAGIFVEDDDPFKGACLPHMHHDTGSDKENEILRDVALVQQAASRPLPTPQFNDAEHVRTSMCAGGSGCGVHGGGTGPPRWALLHRPEDVDALLGALNARGHRERALHASLYADKERIRGQLEAPPAFAFSPALLPLVSSARKSSRHQGGGGGAYAGTPPRHAHDLTLRDMILELEHNIFHGGLGSLKVEDRESWRAALEQGAYDTQIEKLNSEESKPNAERPVEELVQELGRAMLELSQGIEPKYLNPPLGKSDKTKQKAEESDSHQKEKGVLDVWQGSVLECRGHSGLFVHLATLERSVAWGRSVLKAHCRICRRRGDGENMLLCDGCNRGHHLYCLKPPLKSIPEGDWFCLSCRPAEKEPPPPRKKEEAPRQEDSSEQSEEEAEEVEESCSTCGEVGTLVCCDACPLLFHPECVNLRRIPRGEWICPKCTARRAKQAASNGSHNTRAATTQAEEKGGGRRKKVLQRAPRKKRTYEDTFEDDYDPKQPPKARKQRTERNATESEKEEENPFKKVYREGGRRSGRLEGGESLDYKACIDLLTELMRHPSAWPFLTPVSKKDAPDYHLVIKRPMDFGTIRSKLNNEMAYATNEAFVRDVFLVLRNAEWFNPKAAPEFRAARDLSALLPDLLRRHALPPTP